MAEPASGAPARVGLLGGGVIGGGWAARFVLAGSDVRLYDPSLDAGRLVEQMLANARRAQSRLSAAADRPEGTLTIVTTIAEACADAQLVQESVPEREQLKVELLAEADRATPPDAVITSSTSGLLPSRISAGMERPERFCVAHPFNPVYLLPLVELCPSPSTAAQTLDRAAAYYAATGMSPLRMRTEIDGFIADRLQEAVWREALWLIHDDVATATEIDDAIRLGPGLRWAFMGPFLTYRIAGGEQGMRHFLAQFGPSLKWPWTKLMDVPELDDELLDKIVEQSERAAPGVPTVELERMRDDCLVEILLSLRAHGVGAGRISAPIEQPVRVMAAGDDVSQPLRLHTARVDPTWVDYNGHTHESRYLQVFGDSSDALLDYLGIDAGYRSTTGTYMTVETHLRHLRETVSGQRLEVETRILGCDEKRLRLHHLMRVDGTPVASAEHMYLHVVAETGRAGPAGAEVLARVRQIAAAQASLPAPEGAAEGNRPLGPE